ncbi:MAG: M28 family peptidase [Phycisphaerales bacterium JB039]
MHPLRWLIVMSVLLSPGGALGQAPGDSISQTLTELGPQVQEYETHITTLANPMLEGRAPGGRGIEIAAEYVEFHFRQLGLAPLFPSSELAAGGAEVLTPGASYRQTLPNLGRELGPDSAQRVRIEMGADGRALTCGTDFVTLGYTGSGRARGGVTFVGYSIEDGRDGYTSYPGEGDLRGRIALMLRYEPMTEEGLSRWAAQGWSVQASLERKIGAAIARGAEAVILVNAPGADDPRARRLIDPDARPADRTFEKPVVMLSIEAADALVRAGDPQGRSLAELRALADGGAAPIDLEGATVEIETSVTTIRSDNIGAALPGRGALADKWIIIGGHYDHVGWGGANSAEPGSGRRVHPGADDNASGTAGVLLAASILRDAYEQTPEDTDLRSIAFVAFTAEEIGLVGSEYFVAHPPMPLDSMSLMFNMDMIGRLRNGEVEIEGTYATDGLDAWVTPYFEESGLTFARQQRVQNNSDHASFHQAGVPILCFFTGYHDEYHRPGDVAALINRAGAVQIVRLIAALALAHAQHTAEAPFVDTEGQRELAEQLQEAPPPALTISVGVSTSEVEGGLLLEDVEADSPAAAGGLRKGDILIEWNGQEVTDIAGWRTILEQHGPGDLVEIAVLRDGKRVTGYVILGRAGGG